MKFVLLFISAILIVISTIYVVSLFPVTPTIDDNTKQLCHIYAAQDHRKEINPERWSWGKDWIKSYDWYGSCINHIKFPVAK
jgi:hypothetical protein